MARERFGTSGLGNGETSISERAKKVNNHSQQVGAPIANGRNRQTSLATHVAIVSIEVATSAIFF